MFHFPYRAPASFATCQSDSISSTFAMFRKVIFIKFFVPLQTRFLSLKIAIFCRIVPRSKSKNRQTLANFISIKQWFSTRSPPGILCVDKITMNKLPAQREIFLRWIPFSNRISWVNSPRSLGILCVDKIQISGILCVEEIPSPGILCVDKIPN